MKSKLIRCITLCSVLALVCGSSAVALADDDDEGLDPKLVRVVQQYIKLGEDLFRLGSYAEAVENFLRAERVLDDADEEVPAPLYRSMARCYDQLGQVTAALSYYKKFIGLADADNERMKRALRDAKDAEGRLQLVLDRTAIRFEVKPDGAELRIDQKTVGKSPLADPVRVRPGPHQVTLWAEGYQPESMDLQLEAGAIVPVLVTMTPSASVTAPKPLKSEPDPKVSLSTPAPWAPWRTWSVVGGATLASLSLVGVVLLSSDAKDLDAEGDALLDRAFPTLEEAQAAKGDAQERYDDASAERKLAVGLGVFAGVAASAAVYLWLSADPKPAESKPGKEQASVFLPEFQGLDLLPRPGGGQVWMRFGF